MLMFAEMINNSVATEATMCPGKHNLDRAVPRDTDGADNKTLSDSGRWAAENLA